MGKCIEIRKLNGTKKEVKKETKEVKLLNGVNKAVFGKGGK